LSTLLTELNPDLGKFIYHFSIHFICGIMATIVESDPSGRIVIPKKVRDDLGISGRTRFLLTQNRRGQILLQKIDVEEIARRLEEELEGKPLEALAESIREEINEKIRSRHPDLSP